MRNKYLNLLILSIVVFIGFASFGQGRKYIRETINDWGRCRNVAITKSNGDLALYGNNGCAKAGLPISLDDALTKLNSERKFIDDVQLTENGSWLILYGNNGFKWNNIPYSLEQKLRQYNNNNEIVYSVTFNDAGEWIIISEDFYSSSDARITSWLSEGSDKYGLLWAACITDDALVAVYEKGYKFLGNVPEDLKIALRNTELNVFRLKIAGEAWFFADKNERCQWFM